MSDLSAIAVEVCAHRYATEAGPWDTRLATIEDLMHDLDDAEVRETLREIAALAIGGMREIDATKGGESRPAEQVAGDIAGPAAGTVGVGCEPAEDRHFAILSGHPGIGQIGCMTNATADAIEHERRCNPGCVIERTPKATCPVCNGYEAPRAPEVE